MRMSKKLIVPEISDTSLSGTGDRLTRFSVTYNTPAKSKLPNLGAVYVFLDS